MQSKSLQETRAMWSLFIDIGQSTCLHLLVWQTILVAPIPSFSVQVPRQDRPQDTHEPSKKRVYDPIVSPATLHARRPHGIAKQVRRDELVAPLELRHAAGCHLVLGRLRIPVLQHLGDLRFRDVLSLEAWRQNRAGKNGVYTNTPARTCTDRLGPRSRAVVQADL